MNINTGGQLRQTIEKAIEDQIITHEEFDEIINVASKDGNIDKYEQALLSELIGMLQDGTVKFAKSQKSLNRD